MLSFRHYFKLGIIFHTIRKTNMAIVENNENNENETLRVRAIILSESGRILLGKNQEDQYSLIGGKLNGDEHPVDAILREIEEESDLTLNKFEMVEYLWKFHNNYVFLFVIKDTSFINLTSGNDPDKEFKGFEWFDAAGVPSTLDPYSEDMLYRFLRVDIFEKDRGIVEAGHIDVIVDGKKVYELEDDVIWETLPKLAQERAKGKKVEFKQILDDGTIIDQTPNPMPVLSSLDINYIIDDLLNKYIPQQKKRPQFEITDEDSYLAKTVWDGTNTKILISNDIIDDEDVLRQVLAHEIIHHHLYTKYGKDVARHGEHFEFLANKINEVEGNNFVSKYADNTKFKTTAKEKSNESFLVYRGIKDVLPLEIKPNYKGDGVFGDGEYYAFEEHDALNYAIGGWGGTGEEFINFSLMLSFKVSPKKPLVLTDENVSRGLKDYNSDTIEFCSDELKKLFKGSTRRSSLTGLVGFDSFILRGDSVDGGDQLILPTHSRINPRLLEFDLILQDEEIAESIAAELGMESQELEEGYPVIYNIPANKLRQVDKILRQQFTISRENAVTTASSSSQTLTLWHGGNLEIDKDSVSHKRGRWEFGPGLYMTTHYDTARKYSKGSRKLYQITISQGTDIRDVYFPIKVCLNFVDDFVIRSKKKDIVERLNSRTTDGKINADTFLNIMINEGAVKNTDTDKLREFIVINGVDYSIQDNAFGWHERMVVLFNTKKIINKKIVTPKDKIEVYDLPTEFSTQAKVEGSNNLIYYRGAPSSDINKGDFPGVWMAKDKKTAEQYGKVWVFELDPSVRILKGRLELNKIAKEFFESLPYDHIYESEEGGDEEDNYELFMFPDDDLVEFLKKRGFDGYEHHSDTFIFNTKKIKNKYSCEDNAIQADYSNTSIPKILYHGTAQKFDELKLNDYGIIWLTDDPIAAKRYAKDNFDGTKTPKNLFTVEIKPKKVVDFRNVKDPIVLKYKKQRQMDTLHGVNYVIPDEEWPKYASYNLLEQYGVDILLEEKVDVAIVLDASGAYDHISYAVLNPNIINVIKREQVTAGALQNHDQEVTSEVDDEGNFIPVSHGFTIDTKDLLETQQLPYRIRNF
jgi:8-oxo-dGTP pyrophosphatase MutT (NUDIX family)